MTLSETAPRAGPYAALLLFNGWLTALWNLKRTGHLEHPVDFTGDHGERHGPACLWEQQLNSLVYNQVSIAVLPLEKGDLIWGQEPGELVEASEDIVDFVDGEMHTKHLGERERAPNLDVYYQPPDGHPPDGESWSMPDENGLRIETRGTGILWWRREAGMMGPLPEVRTAAFPGMWIQVLIHGEITMYPDEEVKKRLMYVATTTEQTLLQEWLHPDTSALLPTE